MDDIRYWIVKAEEQYKDLQADYPTNTEFNFELGRIYYNYPFLYGTEDKINYGKAIKFFENALLYYNYEQKKKGWDKEAYYYLGNIYYDLWKKGERKEYQEKSIEYFSSALQEKPGKLDDKFRFCAEKMRDELKGGEECDFTPKQRTFNGCRPPPY